jgi:uncharacterized membrane protein YiaA
MINNLNFTTNVSRFAFIFLIFVLITSGYIKEILSCQMRKFIKKSIFIKHLMTIIVIFAFIMFEGGWDFDKSREDNIPNNWTCGNTIHTLIISVFIYFIFLISSKSQLTPNIIFFSILFIIYITNTYREYIYKRNEITESTNNNIIIIEQILTLISIIILIYGFIDYYNYQRKQHPEDFSYYKFLLETKKCNFE